MITNIGPMRTTSAEIWRKAGCRLREARVSAGITRAEMAQCLGWSVAHLANVEAGSHMSGRTLVSLYASALGVAEEGLFA